MFDLSKDQFQFELGNRSFLLTHTHMVLVVLVSSVLLSRILVALIAEFDTVVHAVSAFVCEYGWTSCASAIGTESIDSLTAAVRWDGHMYHLTHDGPEGLLQALCRWDCGWYANIWSNGYDTEPFSNHHVPWPWFPLFPLAVAPVAHWLPSLAMEYAVVLNHVFLLATGWLLYLLTWHLSGSRTTGLAAAILFIVSPFSVYSSVPLGESIFNVLSIGAVYAAHRGRWLACGLAMALLTASRPHGLFIALPVLIIAMRQVGFREFFRIDEHPRIWFALALAPLGICLYALHLHSVVGDALAFSNVQVAWGRTLESWPINYYAHFQNDWNMGWFWRPLFLASTGILALCAAGYLAIRKFFPEAIFLGSIAILTTGTSLGSLPRYLLTIWPIYLALALALRNRPRTTITVAAAFLALLPIYTIAYISGHVWI